VTDGCRVSGIGYRVSAVPSPRPAALIRPSGRSIARLIGIGSVLLLVAGWVAQDPPPRYTAAMLANASFDQRLRAEVSTQAGGAARSERIGRDARLELRVTRGDTALALEAWFDSLDIWRDGPEGRVAPDPDAVIGGRYRGVLAPDGALMVNTRPFLPDELIEVTDLAEALHEFLPRLPRVALAPGGVWQDAGFRIVRRTDSTAAGVPLQRYRWRRLQADTVEQGLTDSLRYLVRSELDQEGDLVWHATRGPLVWRQRSSVRMEIPADGPVQRAARTQMTEEIWVWQRLAPP